MASDTRNVKLGVCSVTFDGVDLGYTKGGVDVAIASTTKEVEVDQFGNSPINEIIIGRTCTAKVPLAETTLRNLARIMPGAVINGSGGAYATGSVTVGTVPADGDKLTINGTDFTFKTVPVGSNDLAIPATVAAAGNALRTSINNNLNPKVSRLTASGAGALVTLTADEFGDEGNAIVVTKTGTSLTVAAMSGGVEQAVSSVTVPNGVGISLLERARALVLHPQALDIDDRSEDFTIPLCSTPGAATFSYKLDNERVFNVDFKAYPDSATKTLFIYGDARSAV